VAGRRRESRGSGLAADGCHGRQQQVITYAGEAEVLAFLKCPANHDSDGRGLIYFGVVSDSTCRNAPSSSNHAALTLVVNGNAPDSLFVVASFVFLTPTGNAAHEIVPTSIRDGDSTVYTANVSAPGDFELMFIGVQVQFPPSGVTFNDDINFAATFIRRITSVYSFETP
jgi:hypothetical protein